MERPVQQSSPQQFEPQHLSIDYLRYLDTLVGNMKATNDGYGSVEIEIAKGKPVYTWIKTGHKTGYQF